ncbi:hypothetical protein D3C87_1824970 [compost metagenome]
MIALKNHLFVAASLRSCPEQFLVEEGIVHGNHVIRGSMDHQHIAAELARFLKRLKSSKRVKINRSKRVTGKV